MNDKKTIAILFGGCSPEYNVSLQSAHAVISHIDASAYEIILIGITKEGDWYLYEGALDNISSDVWHKDCCTSIAISPNRTDAVILKLLENHVEKIHIDFVLPILHGKTEKMVLSRDYLNWPVYQSLDAAFSLLPCAWTRIVLTNWHTLQVYPFQGLMF